MIKGGVLAIISSLGCAMLVQGCAPVPPQGDPVRGEVVYAQYIACHSPARHRTGPKLCGLVGRKAGTAKGYEYSKAMLQAGVVWSAQTLDEFLYAPLVFIPGTSMGIAGIKKDADRRDLIAYLIVINGQHECG